MACRSVCRDWRVVCGTDEVVATAVTMVSGKTLLSKLLFAKGAETDNYPSGRVPSRSEAIAILTHLQASPQGSFQRRLVEKGRRKRSVCPYPSAVLHAVRRRARLIESSRSKRIRLPILRAYDEHAADWYGWWTPEAAKRGAMIVHNAGQDPFDGTHVQFLRRLPLE